MVFMYIFIYTYTAIYEKQDNVKSYTTYIKLIVNLF